MGIAEEITQPGTEDWKLLERHAPRLHYDSQATCWAEAVDGTIEDPGTRLVRNRRLGAGETIASGSGVPALTLATLEEGGYPPDWEPESSDRLELDLERLRRSRRIRTDPAVVDRVYAHVARAGETVFLQYWLWFHDPGTHTGAAARKGGAWRLAQVELGADKRPQALLLERGHRFERVPVDRACWFDDGLRPEIYVSPWTLVLLAAAGQRKSFPYDHCDGLGENVEPTLSSFDGWVSWPGLWGEFGFSPAHRPAWKTGATPNAFADLLVRAVAPVVDMIRRRTEPPPTPRLQVRLERDRLLVRYSFDERQPQSLYIAVKDGRRVLATGFVPNPRRRGEEVFGLVEATESCEVRATAMSGAQRVDAEPVSANVSDVDELEEAIFKSVLEEELRGDEVRRHVQSEGGDLVHELRTAVTHLCLGPGHEDERRRLWAPIARDVQAFRDAQVADFLRRRVDAAAVGLGRALQLYVPLALVMVAALVVVAVVVDAGAAVFGGIYAALFLWMMAASVQGRLRRVRAAGKTLRLASGRGFKLRHDVRTPLSPQRRTFERALRERLIAPAIRETLNARTAKRYSTLLAFDDPGVADSRVSEYETRTAARQRLDQLTARMRHGSIGLAGPRGAGKTTLIRAFCEPRDANDRRLTAVLAAPTEYQARDFVLTIWGELCERVLGAEPGLASIGSTGEVALDARLRRFVLPLVGSGLGFAALLGVAPATGLLQWLLVAVAVVALPLSGRLAWKRMRAKGARTTADADRDLRDRAREALREVHFQQSFSQSYTGKLALPVGGAELATQQGSAFAQNPLSFPEVVKRLKAFMAVAARARGSVVIGIDELDKMGSAEDAKRFLNEIKAVFGVERCFYLVSISEGAMSDFERRGLPFRNVFDSSFDEVLRVAPLPLRQSKAVLNRRVVGLTPPFMDLAHCLSGGLARDLLRVLRELSAHKEEGIDLAEATRRLVRADLDRKITGAMIAARDSCNVEPATSALLRWLSAFSLPAAGGTTADYDVLFELSAKLPDDWSGCCAARSADDAADGIDALEGLRIETAGFVYFLATVLELFTETTAKKDFTALEHRAGPRTREVEADLEASPPCAIDLLARARGEFEMNPYTAIDRISVFRTERGFSATGVPPAAPSAPQNGAGNLSAWLKRAIQGPVAPAG